MTVTTTTTEQPVLLTFDGAVARLTLNRPKQLNVLDEPMAAACVEAMIEIEQRSDLGAVILAGTGRAFMGGGDLAVFHRDLLDAPATAERLIDRFHVMVTAIRRLPVPVIAAVHGAVAGGGVGLALACDIVIAASDVRFVPAYTRIGTSPDGGTTWSLTRALGSKRAYETFLTGETLDAETALRLGMINRVVAADQLSTTTTALAHELAAGPRHAFANCKRLVQQAATGTFEAQLAAERAGFISAAGTADFREGISAFFDRREPRFGES